MAKYIEAERLRAEVKRLEKAAHKFALGCADSERRKFYEGKDYAYQHVGILIDSLQQEQQEVNLEEEFNDFLDNIEGVPRMWHSDEQIKWAKDIARHFYELGLNARK